MEGKGKGKKSNSEERRGKEKLVLQKVWKIIISNTGEIERNKKSERRERSLKRSVQREERNRESLATGKEENR